MEAPRAGRDGAIPIVSSSESRPSSTSDSATAPEKALATLAMRMWSLARGLDRAGHLRDASRVDLA